MNMISRKLRAAPAPIDGSDVLDVLRRRLRELQVRRDALTKKILVVEATTANRMEVPTDVAQVEALLAGDQFVPSREKPMSQLSVLYAERAVIDHALRIGGSRANQLEIERATEIWAAHFSEIAEMEKRRVMLALELQRVNRAREKLREKINRAGGAGYLSTDSVEFLGLGDLAEGEVHWACERLIADGIASKAEIERAKNG